jgi:hypothetical protein
MPESAYGSTSNCIGIGDVLRRRGHRVVFAAEASWRGRLEPLGLESRLRRSSRCGPPSTVRMVGEPNVWSTGESSISALNSSGCVPTNSTSS